MTSETRAFCKDFMQDPHDFRAGEGTRRTPLGQGYGSLGKKGNRKLIDLIDAEFSQVVISVGAVQRTAAFGKLSAERVFCLASFLAERVFR